MKDFISKYKSDIIFVSIIVILAITWSVNISILHINGKSMHPSLHDGQILFLKKDKSRSNGDIVVFNPEDSWRSENERFIKRIIAKEGDTVTVNNDSLEVNGEHIADVSDKKCGLKETREFTIKGEEFFMVGDNYAESNDSLTQLCNRNEDFLISERNILFSGKKLYTFKGGFISE